MATIRYLIKGKRDLSTIYLRFKHGREYDFVKKTSLVVPTNYWSVSKGTVKQASAFKDKLNLQNKLNDLKSYILNDFNHVYANGGVISSDWLNRSIMLFFDQSIELDYRFFIDYAKYFYSNLESRILQNGKTGVSTSTVKKYDTTISKILDFEKYKNIRVKVEDVNLNFHKDFVYFLRNKHKLNYNTIGKYLTSIKTISYDAKKYGLKVCDEVLNGDFRITKEKVFFTYLNHSEIESIYKFPFLDESYLNNARNWLIIGVWTGARVSDLLNFTKENVKNGYIEYTAVKTNQKIVLPLHPHVENILYKNNGNFPHKISSQKLNDYIKIVCQKVGLNELVTGSKNLKIKGGVWRKVKGEYEKWELVSSHICRRSFATNHYGVLPTPVIMSITGHKTEKMFLKYIGKTSKDNAEILKKFWTEQESKKDKKVSLKVVKKRA